MNIKYVYEAGYNFELILMVAKKYDVEKKVYNVLLNVLIM